MPMVSVDIETIPSIHTEGAVTLVSDSGIVRYLFSAKIWQIYNKAAEPYDYFPEGIHVEQFDSLFQTVTEIVADTAYNYKNTDLWHALGNVVVKNVEGEVFETSELFWNAKAPADSYNAFYSNKKVKVTKPNGTVVYGQNGFIADGSLTEVRFYNLSKSELYIEDSKDAVQQQPVMQDSIQAL